MEAKQALYKKKVMVPRLRFKGFNREWKKFLMSEVATKITDGTHDTPKQITEGVPFITAIHVKDGKIDFDNCYYLDQKDHDIIYKRCNPELGDLLVVNIGAGTATCASVNVDYEFSLKNVALIKPNRSVVYPDYLSQLQRKNSKRLFLQLTSGGAQPFLSLKELGKLKINIPTLPEQQKIASFLSAVDEKIQQLTRKKELLEQYKKGVMQQLFSGKLRFKDENGREFPKWDEKRLGNMLQINATYGIVTAGEFQNDGIKMVRGGDIKNGKVSNDCPFVSHEKSKEYKRTCLKQKDIVIALVGYPGEAAVIPEELVGHNISRAVGLLRLLEGINSNFIVQYLNSPIGRKVVLKPSAGSAQQVVNLKDLNNLVIPYPTEKEQNAIANYLINISNKIDLVSNQINQTQTFKKGLLQQMFV